MGIVIITFVLVLTVGYLAVDKRSYYYNIKENSNYLELEKKNKEKIKDIDLKLEKINDDNLNDKSNIEKSEVLDVWVKMLKDLKTSI